MPAEPTYCTADDVRLYTNNADLADDDIIDDTALEAKIVAAEVYIDRRAGYWARAGGITQERVFPRVQDAQIGTDIPQAIMMATIAQVEFMYVNMPDVDHGIEPDASPTSASISPRAKELIDGGYRCITGSVEIPFVQSRGIVNAYGVDGLDNPKSDIHFQDVN